MGKSEARGARLSPLCLPVRLIFFPLRDEGFAIGPLRSGAHPATPDLDHGTALPVAIIEIDKESYPP